MSPSATGFELAFLKAIWIGTAVLCVASLIIMVVLILRRAAASREVAQRDARRQTLSRFILAALKSPVALDATALPPVTPADFPVLVSLALDMLRSLRGGDAVRICSLLKLWGIEPYLLTMASRGRPGRRIRAVTLLGFFDDDTSLEVLLSTARDREMYVQIAALRALAQRGAASHIDTITDSLAQSGQTNTLLLHDILQRFGASAVPALARLASSPASAEVRTAAVMALGSIGAVEAVPALIILSEDAVTDVRAQAVAALGRIADPRAAAAMAGRLDDLDPGVRVHAAQALGELHALPTLPALAGRLNDEDWWVRFRAAEAIHRFGDRGVAALKALSRQPGTTGEMAAQALLEFTGAR